MVSSDSTTIVSELSKVSIKKSQSLAVARVAEIGIIFYLKDKVSLVLLRSLTEQKWFPLNRSCRYGR